MENQDLRKSHKRVKVRHCPRMVKVRHWTQMVEVRIGSRGCKSLARVPPPHRFRVNIQTQPSWTTPCTGVSGTSNWEDTCGKQGGLQMLSGLGTPLFPPGRARGCAWWGGPLGYLAYPAAAMTWTQKIAAAQVVENWWLDVCLKSWASGTPHEVVKMCPQNHSTQVVIWMPTFVADLKHLSGW